MNKYFFACVFIISISITSMGQAPIKLLHYEKAVGSDLRQVVKAGSLYTFDALAAKAVLQQKPISFTLSFHFENEAFLVELTRADIFSNHFFVSTSSATGIEFGKTVTGLFYRGKVKGKPGSVAAISIFPAEIIGVIADEKGNINIGQLQRSTTNGEAEPHIMYRDADAVEAPLFSCQAIAAAQDAGMAPAEHHATTTGNTVNTEPVDIYFEADNSCFTGNGSNVTNTANWVSGIFNIVAALYAADSVLVQMSGIKVWTSADPYMGISATNIMLNAFAGNMANGFPGDLAHLLSRRNVGGGIAYIEALCSVDRYRIGVSGNMSSGTNPLPAYSWNSMVITHETGHNMGSNHTQWCGWPGGAIDNCYTTEGGCPPGPAPTNGGTIMSYCHLSAAGINLANGFGPLPGTLIRNRLRNNNCIFPKISFNISYQTVTEEEATGGNGCQPYSYADVKLKLNYPASQPAVITLTPQAMDSPGLSFGENNDLSFSVTDFSLVDTTPQLIRIKVNDDAIIENKETMRLDYLLAANGTNAVKNGVYQLEIISLDHKPDSTINQILFTEIFDGIETGMGAWTQEVLYGNTSPNRWMVGNSGDQQFSSKAIYISSNGNTACYAGSVASDSILVRLQSPVIDATGFSNIKLSLQYKCNGEGGGSQGTGGSGKDLGKIYYSKNAGASWTLLRDNIFWRNLKTNEEITLPADASNTAALQLGFTWQNNASTVNNPPFIIDSVVLKGTGAAQIQTTAHNSNSQTLPVAAYQTVYFYNPATKNIMAALRNQSSENLGCVTLEILRTGDSACAAWGLYDDESVAAKTFRLSMQNNVPNAAYTFTAYYSNAELQAWASATGAAINEARLVQCTENLTIMPLSSQPYWSNTHLDAEYGNDMGRAIAGVFKGSGTFSIGRQGISTVCPGSIKMLPANDEGIAYQWQQDTGGGYTNLINGAVVSGASGPLLQLNNAPTDWYGRKYRCAITKNDGLHFSIAYTLRFAQNWVGSEGSAWENTENWGCGSLPDANTDVFIGTGYDEYPVLHGNAAVRSLTLKAGASVNLHPGITLDILH